VLPLPRSLTIQIVHAADVADLIRRALRARARGAYNVAAEPVLGSAEIAAVLGLHRVPVPGTALRTALGASSALRVQPLDRSWFDLLAHSPLVDTRRAREELGWEPAYPADQVLAELREAAVAGAGTVSARLAPQRG
jgi:nucleoside-diphosphate-sugar epimerase